MWIKKSYHNHLLGLIDQLGNNEESMRRKLEQKTKDYEALNRENIRLMNQIRCSNQKKHTL